MVDLIKRRLQEDGEARSAAATVSAETDGSVKKEGEEERMKIGFAGALRREVILSAEAR